MRRRVDVSAYPVARLSQGDDNFIAAADDGIDQVRTDEPVAPPGASTRGSAQSSRSLFASCRERLRVGVSGAMRAAVAQERRGPLRSGVVVREWCAPRRFRRTERDVCLLDGGSRVTTRT